MTKDPTEAPERDEMEALAAFGDAATAAGKDSRVYLYRLEPKSLKTGTEGAWLEVFDGEAPTLAEIRETYGGGRFRLKLLRGGKWTGTAATFSIEGRPKFIDGETVAGAAAASPIDARFERLEKLLEGLLLQRQDGAGRDTEEFWRTFRQAKLAKLLSDAPPAADPIKMLEGLLGVVERTRGDAGPDDDDEDGEDPMMRLVTKVAEILSSAKTPAPAPRVIAARPQLAAPATPAEQPSLKAPGRLDGLKNALRARVAPAEVAAIAGRFLAPVEVEQVFAMDVATWQRVLAAGGVTIPGEKPEEYLEQVKAALVAFYENAATATETGTDDEIEEGGGSE